VTPPPAIPPQTETQVRIAVLESELRNLSADVSALKRAFYTFAFGAVGSAVLFALSVFALLGQK